MGNDIMWKTNESKEVYQNPFFKVKENQVIRHNDTEATYYVVQASPSVFVIPQDKDGKIYFIKQYRYPNNNISWEVPAGAVDSQEDPLKAAQRELYEESGITAKKWSLKGQMYLAPGLLKNKSLVYLASELSQKEIEIMPEEAILDCQKFSWKEIQKLIQTGELNDGPTLAALNLAFLGPFDLEKGSKD